MTAATKPDVEVPVTPFVLCSLPDVAPTPLIVIVSEKMIDIARTRSAAQGWPVSEDAVITALARDIRGGPGVQIQPAGDSLAVFSESLGCYIVYDLKLVETGDEFVVGAAVVCRVEEAQATETGARWIKRVKTVEAAKVLAAHNAREPQA